MIAGLEGIIIEKSLTRCLLNVQGVIYDISITISCYESMGTVKDSTLIFTYLSVSENNMALYGFSSLEEREIFLKLISVSGIGPKSAQTILSGISPNELISSIQNENIDRLKSISGIGKKSAERIVLELKDKFTNLITGTSNSFTNITKPNEDLITQNSAAQEAVSALISLGYKRFDAGQVVNKLLKENPLLSTEEIIKASLRKI